MSESSRAIDEISVGILQIASSAQHVSSSAVQTSEKASEGNQAIQTAVKQMKSINQTVNGLAEVVKMAEELQMLIRKFKD